MDRDKERSQQLPLRLLVNYMKALTRTIFLVAMVLSFKGEQEREQRCLVRGISTCTVGNLGTMGARKTH